jgi:TonB family protein
MKKRTTTLAIVLLVMGSVIVSYCLTNDLGGFMTDKTIANTSVIQTQNSAIETKETTVQQPNKETNRKIYQTVEQMPEFPEGTQALMQYIRSHLQPPPDSIRNRIQGRVIVRFVVEPDGTITNAEVIKGLHPFCDREAIRLIESMPQWIPGKHNGIAVPVYFYIPVSFTITNYMTGNPSLGPISIADRPDRVKIIDFPILDTTTGNRQTTVPEIYYVVEQMPRFPGGDTAMLKYIRENLRYPQAAIEKEIQGRVIVKLVVNTDGILSDIYVIKPLDPQCDQEAIRIIQSMPRWIPGRHNGVAVPVYYLVPVTFKI